MRVRGLRDDRLLKIALRKHFDQVYRQAAAKRSARKSQSGH